MTTSDTNIVDQLAAPDSLLGMLQRGRGAGYLAALSAPRETAWPLLVECVTNDPRLEQECEDRADYYASLILATGMDLSLLQSGLRQNDSQNSDPMIRPSLPIETLVYLTWLGSHDAVQMLRDYISFGKDWAWAIMFLGSLHKAEVLDGIDEVLLRRVKSSQSDLSQLQEMFREPCWWYYRLYKRSEDDSSDLTPLQREPWKTLCHNNPELAKLLAEMEEKPDPAPPSMAEPVEESLEALSLGELFASVNPFTRVRALNVIPDRVSLRDEDFLLENLSSETKYRVMLALEGLARLGTPRAFEAVKKAYIEASENTNKVVRQFALNAIGEMPGSLTLDTARQWFRREEWYLQVAAGEILENHATVEDIPLLIEALRTPETIRREDFRLAYALEALARFEGIGPIPELERIFCEAPCCFDRSRAVIAMAATAPIPFRDQYAFECLWDCHWYTCQLGCETVNLWTPGARERLKELARDPQTYDDTRQAAQKRLVEL